MDWAAELELPTFLMPSDKTADATGSFELPEKFSVLLTGSTGYLGGYILKALLSNERITEVYVLVRSPERATAKGLDKDPRVRLVAGDCGKDRLGMSEDDWTRIAGAASAVVHNAAEVNWIKPHAAMRAVNVGGTLLAMRMCTDPSGPSKRLVCISSISAYQGQEQTTAGEEPLFSFDDSEAMEQMGGYGSTKRVSEELARRARANGVLRSACVVRPGTISGATEDGHSNSSDTFNRFLMSICIMGAAPDLGEDAEVTMAPVDHVADVVIRGMVAEEKDLCAGYTVVGHEGVKMEDIVSVCGEASKGEGGTIDLISLEEFLRRVSQDKRNPLAPLVGFFEGDTLPVRNEGAVFPHANKQELCRQAGDQGCGVGIGDGVELIRKYIQFMRNEAAASSAPSAGLSVKEREALVVIDMQYDFIDGSLPVPGAAALIPAINNLRSKKRFDLTIFTQDWHAPNHVSFASNHDGYDAFEKKVITYAEGEVLCGAEYVVLYGEEHATKEDVPAVTLFQQVLWPDHCVAGTRGAEYHSELDTTAAFSLDPLLIHKGINEHIDSYSSVYNVAGSSDTNLPALLAEKGIDSVYVVGVALDFCVKFSALDLASKLNLKTTVLMDATEGIAEESINEAIAEMKGVGVKFGKTSDLI